MYTETPLKHNVQIEMRYSTSTEIICFLSVSSKNGEKSQVICSLHKPAVQELTCFCKSSHAFTVGTYKITS